MRKVRRATGTAETIEADGYAIGDLPGARLYRQDPSLRKPHRTRAEKGPAAAAGSSEWSCTAVPLRTGEISGSEADRGPTAQPRPAQQVVCCRCLFGSDDGDRLR